MLFGLTGIAVFAFWALARPSFEMTTSMQEWPAVLWFSATLLVLAVAILVFGRMVGGRSLVRLANLAAGGVALSSAANILEDGFRIGAAFFAFILGTFTMDLALIALTVVMVRTLVGRQRLLALVPAGTVAGILLFVPAGGPTMLVTWLSATAAAAVLPRWRASTAGGGSATHPARRMTDPIRCVAASRRSSRSTS